MKDDERSIIDSSECPRCGASRGERCRKILGFKVRFDPRAYAVSDTTIHKVHIERRQTYKEKE